MEAHRTAARAAMAAEVEARRVREERAGALEVRRERIAAIDALLNTAATSADRALSEANAAQDRAARAAEEARSLEDLADRLTDPQRPGSGVPRLKTWALRELALANARPGLKPGRSRAPTLAGLPAPRRGLASPIVGGVRSTFDDAQAADADLPGRGLVFVGAPGAEVSAPADAAVVFARRYLRYGRVLILDLGGGDQLVMIGCERLYVRAGEVVRRGQAIGRLPSNGQMRLYLEIRRQRRSVDPSPWFDAKTASANG